MSEPTVTPFLWFNNDAEEAAEFYQRIFARGGRSTSATKLGSGKMMGMNVDLNGQKLVLFNGGPMFPFTEAISLSVACEGQEEIDYFWDALVEGGTPSRCGWLKDKFGLSWQIVPRDIIQLLQSQAAVNAMMGMSKLIVAELKNAGVQA